MNAQATRPNEWPQNERTKAVNERTDNIMYEGTNKPNNRTSEMTAKQPENGPMARTNRPANPATQQMAYFFFETKEKNTGSVWFRTKKSISERLEIKLVD